MGATRRVLVSWVLCGVLAGCGLFTPVRPRFQTPVATSLACKQMRRLETDSLVVYFPAERRDEARRVARHLEVCSRALRRPSVTYLSKRPTPDSSAG